MNMSEDKLRTVLEETAWDIPAHEVPPLRLAGGRRPSRLRVSRRRWLGWFTPLAAAVSVAAVVASLAFAGAFASGHRPAAGQAAHRPGGPFAGLPPYYVLLTDLHPRSAAPRQHSAVIRATATGKVVATVTAPKPYDDFALAAGTGDGRTFVLAADTQQVSRVGGATDVQTSPLRLFRLRIGAGGHPALTPLPIPPQPAGDLAVSPDGSKLAIGDENTTIRVFDLATGAERTWTWPGRGRITNNAGGNGEVLSWTANDRTLAFQQWVGNSIDVRLLDITAPGGDLQRASRLALQWQGDAETFHYVHGKVSNVIDGFSAIITPDGSKIVAAAVSENKQPLASELMFTEFAAATGRPVAVLGRWRLPGLYPGQIQDVEWASPSGGQLIVLAHKPGPPVPDPQSSGHRSAAYGIEFGVQTAAGFTPLPGAPVPGPGPWPIW
jgi:hypothetical protein